MTEETTAQVPLLDLAPKLKRPLSLWNPFDYLLLLYWVFYFPQAIRWYVEIYAEPAPESDLLTWQQGWDWLRNSPSKLKLALMGIFLAIAVPLSIRLSLQSFGVPIDWNWVAINVAVGVAISVAISVAVDVGYGVMFGVAYGVAYGVVSSAASGVAYGVAFGVTSGVAFGVAAGLSGGVVSSAASGVAYGVAFGVAVGVASGVTSGVTSGVAVDVAFGLAFGLATLRPEVRWLSFGSIPRITPLVLPRLTYELETCLKTDWQNGLKNANQLLIYSLQFATVDIALNKTLTELPSNQLIDRIATLSDLIWDWEMLRYTSSSLSSALKDSFIDGIFWLPYKSWFKERWGASYDLRFDTEARTTAAGFWYLHEASLTKAVETFANLRQITHGEEIYQLASNICNFSKPQDLESLLNLEPIPSPPDDLLRPQTWAVINNLSTTVEEIQALNQTKSRITRSFAFNRALGQISEALETLDALPPEVSRVEKPILKVIATRWRDILLDVASDIGQVEIDKPIANPYTIGDPVLGDRFIGRDDILRQLEELWFINTSPQSVILYGHRRMGKTSILRNATTKVNSQVRVAYVNLLLSSSSKGIADILMAICDALEEVTNIPVPSNNDLSQFPETTFRRYLEQITKTFTGKGLIIALDEFEKIEELIDAGKLSKEFLGFLRGMVQMSSKLAFAFAGLHTLQEMNADYFQPFYASFIPIPVAFLTREATHQVLANPDPEFLLEYEPAALDYIYQLTNGQPYLTQLIGFQLVRKFNDYFFEQGKPRDRTFTIEDVRTVCGGENFFNTGIHYFNGVWQQAAEGATNQHDILKALALHPQGLTELELIAQTNLPNESLQAALKTLKDHDVICNLNNSETQWAIAVELFLTWVVKYKLNPN